MLSRNCWMSSSPSTNRRFEIRSVWSTKNDNWLFYSQLYFCSSGNSWYNCPNPVTVGFWIIAIFGGGKIPVTFTWPANLSQKALWGIWGIPMERNCVHLHRLPALQSRRTIGWVCRWMSRERHPANVYTSREVPIGQALLPMSSECFVYLPLQCTKDHCPDWGIGRWGAEKSFSGGIALPPSFTVHGISWWAEYLDGRSI